MMNMMFRTCVLASILSITTGVWAINRKQQVIIGELKQINKMLENFISEPMGMDDE
jgi:hypothetical protein